MKKPHLLLILLALVFGSAPAQAQLLPGAADQLRGTLKTLSRVVDDRLSKDQRKDVQGMIEKTRGDLDHVRDSSAQGQQREDVNVYLGKAHDHLGGVWKRLGDVGRKGPIRELLDTSRFQMQQIDDAFSVYQGATVAAPDPGYIRGPHYDRSRDRGDGPPLPPQAYAREARTEEIGRRIIADYFNVPPDGVEFEKAQRTGDVYRSWVRIRGQGEFIVDNDAVSGAVIKAWRQR